MKPQRTQVHHYFATIQEHVVAMWIAVFVLASVVWVVTYRDSLFADITGANKWEWAVAWYASPIVYEVKDGKMIVQTSQSFAWVTSLSFFIMYDPTKLILWLENASSQYKLTYAPSWENMIQVTLFVKWDIPANATIYELPINGEVSSITITNAWVMWDGGAFESLAIQSK